MNYLDQLQRGIDYIEAHLEHDLELRRVSKVAGISHWHFQRIFKAMTGETLLTYVRARRLANALDRLLTTDAGILEIAMRAGFGSQEAFTRAFKRSFGLTPNQYRKLGDRSLFLKKVIFDADYLRHINENLTLEPEIYTQPAMRLVGLRTHFFGVESDKNNVGETLPVLWERFIPRLQEISDVVPGRCYGVVHHDGDDGDRLAYHAAIEVRHEPDALPADMVAITLPGATYAKFGHRGPAKNIDATVNYIYSTWLTQSGRRHSYGPDLETYGDDYHPTSDNSRIDYAIPVTDAVA